MSDYLFRRKLKLCDETWPDQMRACDVMTVKHDDECIEGVVRRVQNRCEVHRRDREPTSDILRSGVRTPGVVQVVHSSNHDGLFAQRRL